MDGLTSAEAARRLAEHGPNQVVARKHDSALGALVRQFGSPLVLMLVIAAGISIGVGEEADAIIILAIVALSGLVGFWQEWRAGAAVEALTAIVAVKARVVRDGAEGQVPLAEIVPGDLVVLDAGAVIPADATLRDANDLHVDEAVLTGESFPVEKAPGAALFLGTHVVSGTGRAIVAETGAATKFGQIADRLAARAGATDFEHGVQRFGFLLMRVTAVLVIAVFAVNLREHRPAIDAFLFALALAVGLVPELLPAIVGVNLARGARRMAKRKVIVKRLAAIENFGSMTVLCSDKTGTVTIGKVTVDPSTDATVLRWAAINARLHQGMDNPIDRAIDAAAPATADAARVAEVPYDFMRRRLSVLADVGGERWLVCKGAVREVAAVCTGAPADLDARVEELAGRGLRTIAVARKRMAGAADASRADEADLELLGLVVLSDPLKPDAREVIAELAALGVKFKMITGDNRHVAAAIARQIGLDAPVLVTGAELRATSSAALPQKCKGADVFAEVDPNQKETILRALRKAGEVVGYMGDGINDAPALHAADASISVASAVDVARQAADVVLLDQDLGVLRDGIEEGRLTFANTLKYVEITTSANFGNMLSMAGAALVLPFLPLLPGQILLNNFLSDVPAMALAGDRCDGEELRTPRRWDTRHIRNYMVVLGAISSLFDAATFGLLWWLGAGAGEFRSGWFVESLVTELAILLVLRTRRPIWRSRPSPLLWGSCLAVALLAVALVSTPLGRIFLLEPLPLGLGAALLGITLAYAAATEFAKRWF